MILKIIQNLNINKSLNFFIIFDKIMKFNKRIDNDFFNQVIFLINYYIKEVTKIYH